MSTPGPPPDPAFLAYVEKEVPRLFRYGWDRNLYPQSCLSSTVPLKSCLQRGISKGGSRAQVLEARGGERAHHSFVLDCLSRESPIVLKPSRVTAVETGGKHRVVSVGDVDLNLFRPLHSAIYNHLTGFKWLLRGEAKASRFKEEFKSLPGTVFCSGDYESATDNLNTVVQESILQGILDNAVSVPKGIRDSAGSTLRMKLFVPGLPEVQQSRGQLMGNLLSFPLLCIVNYLAFRFYSGARFKRDSIPVRVNGDDIVFRAPGYVVDRWKRGVIGSGLKLSPGKTMVHGSRFSLNSSLFKAGRSKVTLVPVIRSTAFGYSARDGSVESLRGRWQSSFPGFYGDRRRVLRVEWLKWNRKWIVASRRSLTRGLGLNVDETEVHRAGLWSRECWYLSMEDESPLPVKRATLDQELRVPPDWELRTVNKITKEMRQEMKGVAAAFVECAWSPSRGIYDDSDYRDRVSSGPNWLGEDSRLRRRAKLLGVSRRNAVRYLKSRLPPPRVGRDWVRTGVTLRSFWRRTRVAVWRPAVDNGAGCPSLQDNEIVGEECPVCMEICVLRTRIGCSHGFCDGCSDEWSVQSASCPLCRAVPPRYHFGVPQALLDRVRLIST